MDEAAKVQGQRQLQALKSEPRGQKSEPRGQSLYLWALGWGVVGVILSFGEEI